LHEPRGTGRRNDIANKARLLASDGVQQGNVDIVITRSRVEFIAKRRQIAQRKIMARDRAVGGDDRAP